jgi:DNA-binding transcriptional regulator YhcF (GntR family)
LEPLLAEKGRQNLERQRDKNGLFTANVSGDTTAIEKIDSLRVVAKKSKVGRATVAKVKKILKKAPEKVKQECRKGTRSINSGYKQVKEAERQEQKNEELADITEDSSIGV